MNSSVIKGLKLFSLSFVEKRLCVEVNKSFIIYDNYTILPINEGVPSLETSKNGKQLMVMNTIVFLFTG